MDVPELDFDPVNEALAKCCGNLKDLAVKRVLARKPRPLTVSTIRCANTTKTESDSDSDSKSGADSDSESSPRVVVDYGHSWRVEVIDYNEVKVNLAPDSSSSASQSASSASLMSASSSNAVQIGQSASSNSLLSEPLVILTKKSISTRDSGLARVRARFQGIGISPSQFLHLAEVYEANGVRVDVCALDLKNYIITHFNPRGSDYEEKNFTEFNGRLSRVIFAQIVLAICSMHSVDLAHLDLKPENILVYDGGRYIKIIDFAECAVLHHVEPCGGFKRFLFSVGGGTSKLYRSPEYEEVCHSKNFLQDLKKLDLRRHDCFSLGVILDQLVCGENREDAEFKKLHSGLTQADPKKRLTLKQVMRSNFFGSDPNAFFTSQAQLCCDVSIDNYVLSVPQDGFFFVPTAIKPVINDIEQLITQTNGLTWATKHVKQDPATVIFMLKKTYQRKQNVVAELEAAIMASRNEEEIKLLAELLIVIQGKALEVLKCAPNLEKSLPYFDQIGRLTADDGTYKKVCEDVLSFIVAYCVKHPVSTDHHAELFAMLDELLAIQKNAREEQVPVILAKYQRQWDSSECSTFISELATKLNITLPSRETPEMKA